ncbi:two-component system OmpR family sensor kinase [Agromyces cerinus]|uniref:sensor histidine kinase n=1 Tax=Agromyces cerinus TaxID=33878 RepID=UPI001EF81730|nr:HAMP domain-containing sensor histidine kinase [Agromyces cerinus]MBM7831823.1 two-component system OmpR family sensor kinase [Agromyces cerinus]
MTRPGDPGYAASARATATAATPTQQDAPELPAATDVPRRREWTLQRRLLLVLAGLLAAVSMVVGVVSVSIFHTSSMAAVDADLRSAMDRAELNLQGPMPFPGSGEAATPLLDVAGQSAGTLAAVVPDTGQADAAYIAEDAQGILKLPPDATATLAAVPDDGQPHTIDMGRALGEFRALSERKDIAPETRVVIALPLAEVNASARELGVTIAVVALAGLVLALGFGSLIVRRALAPLSRMTETAQHVSELPLDRGDVALAERVPVDDERTEVGRLGGAFNRMLGHVASALSAREQSEQKVRRFVADASHELRTPLASIRGYAELTRLHGGELPPDVVHAIGRIESESVRMTELVEDLLLLARLDEGRELGALPVDLGRVVVEAIGDAQAAGPGHDWEVRLPDAPAVVVGDEPRLRQVVTNLLANARVHTPDGTAVVASLEHDGDDIVLTVEDDGPGIPPALADSLFERFARGDSSRSRIAGSTGLGLAIVRGVTLAHGGTVDVASEPGRTRFTVRLPAETGAQGD